MNIKIEREEDGRWIAEVLAGTEDRTGAELWYARPAAQDGANAHRGAQR